MTIDDEAGEEEEGFGSDCFEEMSAHVNGSSRVKRSGVDLVICGVKQVGEAVTSRILILHNAI